MFIIVFKVTEENIIFETWILEKVNDNFDIHLAIMCVCAHVYTADSRICI